MRRHLEAYAKRIAPAVVHAAVVTGPEVSYWPEDRPPHRFHVGSVTKVFTGLLLAKMTVGGEVGLSDRIGDYFDVSGPAGAVTMAELASHTSGLPRLPAAMLAKGLRTPADPYSGLSERDVLSALRRARLLVGRGRFGYSNFGYGVLGLALGRSSDGGFHGLVRERLLAPLGLHGTVFDIDSEEQLVDGHGRTGRVVPHWHNPTLAGCGSLVSTIEDLAAFLLAQLQGAPAELGDAMALSRSMLQVDGSSDRTTGLGWMIDSSSGSVTYWHNGATSGFSAYLALEPDRGRGIAVLTNRAPAGDRRVDALVQQLRHVLPA